jgi:hypothetical protein
MNHSAGTGPDKGPDKGRVWVNGPSPQQQMQIRLSRGGPGRGWHVEMQQDERGENLYFGSLALFIGYLAQLEMAPRDAAGTGAVYGLR